MNKIYINFAIAVALLVAASVAVNADTNTPMLLVKDACPGLTSSALASAKLTSLPSGVVLRSGEMKVTQKDLDSEIAKAPLELRPQLKRNLFFLLENKVTLAFFETEAAAWAKKNKRPTKESRDDLMQAYLLNFTSNLSVSEEEAKSFFDNNRDMIGEATFDQVKDQLKDFMLEQKRKDAIEAYMDSTSERHDIEINKAWGLKQLSAAMDNPIDKVRKSSLPTMVDLGADGCRPCEMMVPILESLTKEYAGKANILFVDVRKEQILAARYDVQSIPVQIFF